MIDLDEEQARMESMLDRRERMALGVTCTEMIELITRLRQAEKDAARYLELRDAESETCLEFINAKARMASPEWLDGMVDEAMQCK